MGRRLSLLEQLEEKDSMRRAKDVSSTEDRTALYAIFYLNGRPVARALLSAEPRVLRPRGDRCFALVA